MEVGGQDVNQTQKLQEVRCTESGGLGGNRAPMTAGFAFIEHLKAGGTAVWGAEATLATWQSTPIRTLPLRESEGHKDNWTLRNYPEPLCYDGVDREGRLSQAELKL